PAADDREVLPGLTAEAQGPREVRRGSMNGTNQERVGEGNRARGGSGRLLLPFFSCLLSVSVPLGLVAADSPKPALRAGAFAQDVTPAAFPISVNGNMADKKATSAHDPLHARCLVLDDGKTKIALVVVDSCMLPRELIDAAKAKAAQKTG